MARNSFSSGSWRGDASTTRSSLSSTSSEPTFNSPTSPTIDQNQDRITWIINHVLECNLSFELPLKIMFSFNAGYRVPTLKEAHKWWQYEPKGTAIIKFLSSLEESKSGKKEDETHMAKEDKGESTELENRKHAAQDPFMDPLHEDLLDIDFTSEFTDVKRASRGLPPEFIRKWCLDKVFTKVEEFVDFSQALTGIDYLQDLECRRREALREVALRLKIEKNNWRKVLSSDPDAKKWVEDIQAQETIIERFYAACFIDLRIWTMLHELKTEPFYKPNVLAMLNTLYPPCIKELPNDLIDLDKLRQHRAKFYNFITQVEHGGTSVLEDFESLLKNPDCKHNWVDTRENLRDYIELASKMIEQSNAIHDIMFFKKSPAIAYCMRSKRARSATASSNTSALTVRHGSQNQEGTTPSGTERPSARLHSKSITDSVQSKECQFNRVASNFSGEPQRSRVEERSQIRKRLASPKRQHEYSQEYCTVPMNAPRTPLSTATTLALPQKQSSSSARTSDGDGNTPGLESQYRRPRENTPFTERNSEAAQHQSFQSWVPLKDQHQMSPFRQRSYPDPWSRGPPNPKYQLPPKELCGEEKLLQALRRPEAPIKRRASFSDEISPSSPRNRSFSINSTKVEPHRMHKGGGATSFETLRAGSPHASQQTSSSKSNTRKQSEKAAKNNPDSPRELLGYPPVPQTLAPEVAHRPPLRPQNSYGSSGGLRGRAMSGSSSIPGSPLAFQHDMPEPSAIRKLQLRKTPLRDTSTDALDLGRIKIRKKPLHDTPCAEIHTPSLPLSNPLSPLPPRQESPIAPTSSNHLRKTALHNSSIGVQTRNASLSVSRSPLPSSLNPNAPSPHVDVGQDGKKCLKSKHANHTPSDSLSGSSSKNMRFNSGGLSINAPVGKTTLPELSPHADLSFLDSPYEPPEEIVLRLNKKSSMATIIQRKSSESLKSVRFEDPEPIYDNASSKTPKRSSGNSKSSGGTLADDNALGISMTGVRSTTALIGASAGASFTDFPPPPQPKLPLKKHKTMGIFPRRESEAASHTVDLSAKPVLKQQKSLGLFPRRERGRDEDKATQPAAASRSGDMGGVFDGSQNACTAYCAHTAIACREPYKFPVPPNRMPITQNSDPKPNDVPTLPSRTPIINDSASKRSNVPSPSTRTPTINNTISKSRPMVQINVPHQSPGISNSSPISPENKVFGFIPPQLPPTLPPLKGVITHGVWGSDLDIALDHEHRVKLEHARSQQHPALRNRAPPGFNIDTEASKEPDQLRKAAPKLSKTTSFAEDTPNLPPLTTGSGKFGSFFTNAGANISAIFVGKSASDTPDPSKSSKSAAPIPSRSDGKDKAGKSHEGKVGSRRERAGSKSKPSVALLSQASINPSNTPPLTALTNFLHTLHPSKIFRKSRRNQHKCSLTHKHKLVSYRKREALLRRHLRVRANIAQRYRRMVILEDSRQVLYAAEGLKWIHRLRPLVRETPEEYRRREYLREWMLAGAGAGAQREGVRGPSGMPFLVGSLVRRGVRRGGRDPRRRFFEGFVGPGVRVGGRGGGKGREQVERVLEKIDWRKEGWFVGPRVRKARVERGVDDGEGEGEGGGEGKVEVPVVPRKYVMISTEKYQRY
ncbi:hypothetical protein DSL72_004994 [Monilinia vaccinii-corymbosi]|uniref:Uncharacterized protein n=1 Tax=Monilinia vaccinii-corymbosi TaxID=61207 RepID=A0A8A3PEF6_9HELO|nr:hypothetical protein DSL72_004994 [Monilinia vaccinii-corymbosi]